MTGKERAEFENGFSFGVDVAKNLIERKRSEIEETREARKDDETFSELYYAGVAHGLSVAWASVHELEEETR